MLSLEYPQRYNYQLFIYRLCVLLHLITDRTTCYSRTCFLPPNDPLAVSLLNSVCVTFIISMRTCLIHS